MRRQHRFQRKEFAVKKFVATFTKPVQEIMAARPASLEPVMRLLGALQMILIGIPVRGCTDSILSKLLVPGEDSEHARLERCLRKVHRCAASVDTSKSWDDKMILRALVQFFGFADVKAFAVLEVQFKGGRAHAVSLHEQDTENGPLQVMYYAEPAHELRRSV